MIEIPTDWDDFFDVLTSEVSLNLIANTFDLGPDSAAVHVETQTQAVLPVRQSYQPSLACPSRALKGLAPAAAGGRWMP